MCLPAGWAEVYAQLQRIDDLDRLAELFASAPRQWMRQLMWSRMQAIPMDQGLERQPFPVS